MFFLVWSGLVWSGLVWSFMCVIAHLLRKDQELPDLKLRSQRTDRQINRQIFFSRPLVEASLWDDLIKGKFKTKRKKKSYNNSCSFVRIISFFVPTFFLLNIFSQIKFLYFIKQIPIFFMSPKEEVEK